MSARLLSPTEAAEVLAKRLAGSWAERVCAEVSGGSQAPVECRVRPGVATSADVERVGFAAWTAWRSAWRGVDLAGVAGARCDKRDIAVRGVSSEQPLALQVDSLAAGLDAVRRLGGPAFEVDIARARGIASRLVRAEAILTPGTLKDACRLADGDVDVAVEAVSWLRAHPALDGWTERQLPVQGMHTKWFVKHASLLEKLTGRDLRDEIRPRPAVVHLTYVDPDYLSSGSRRHDAWTTGDAHELAYRPRVVVVVENRDCRLGFPPLAGAIVVEGAGKAAASSLSGIGWLVEAERIVYWGDIDVDGFAILDNLRAALLARGVPVESILMNEVALARYAHLGVNRDKYGEVLRPSAQRLPHLTEGEAACYAGIATAGSVTFRRIEQERIPFEDAVAAVRAPRARRWAGT